MHNRIILHYAELTLKGCNRHSFVKKLRTNVRNKLKSLNLSWDVVSIHDRMFIEVPESYTDNIDNIANKLTEVPGIAWLSKVYWFSNNKYDIFAYKPNLSEVEALIQKLAKATYQADKSFAIRVKRSDKRFIQTSKELEMQLATVVLKNTEWKKVNLNHADQYFYVDISSRGMAVHTNRIKAIGGLPVAASGRIMTLLSGGFDSPIAAYLMAKRGCTVDFIHFTASNIHTSKLETYKVARIAQRISEFAGRVRLYLVPYTHFDLALMDKSLDYDLILFRRFMARVAEKMANEVYAQCLVTGDNLGQVASQTMENIVSMTKSITMPVLRPLLTYNKEEIVTLSRKLDLFELCVEPYKDCCALISNSPKTKSLDEKLTHIETTFLPDYEQLIHDTLAEKQVIAYQFGKKIGYV
ncbi:tRNA 4-thiouridine synthase [hydrothermal vent metagenome]|uniref:tRNA 4-thiouridine synthase n=1 Tax=hydrothermal vent metagenome TaxID=652676 RepID=A0A3B0VPM3_9ZZZZ